MSVLVTAGAVGVGVVSGWLLAPLRSIRPADWRTIAARALGLSLLIGQVDRLTGPATILPLVIAVGAGALLAVVWRLSLIRHVKTRPDSVEP
jgi:hypothetical protein